MSWTDERVELLKKLWADGLSASQIAGELGGITRNAVIGKVHRLGLSGRAKSPSSSAPRARKPRSHMMRVQRPMSRGNTALALAYEMDQEPEPELIENIIPIGQRRTLLELNERHLPLADRRSGDLRILLLRRQAAGRPALLQLSLARRLSAGQRAPQPQAAVPAGLNDFTIVDDWPRRNPGLFCAARHRPEHSPNRGAAKQEPFEIPAVPAELARTTEQSHASRICFDRSALGRQRFCAVQPEPIHPTDADGTANNRTRISSKRSA